MRGLGIARRVLNKFPDFARYSHDNPRIFMTGLSNEVRSSMFVLSQFPMETSVDLLDFVQNAERVAHIVLQSLYAQDLVATKAFLEQLATPDSLKTLLGKPSSSMQNLNGSHAKLEQLKVKNAALESVEYTWERVNEEVKSEWLTIQMHYDVTEHLLISAEDEKSIKDRRVINTQFSWTFEADVTKAEETEWGIVAATPFLEKVGVLTKSAAQKDN